MIPQRRIFITDCGLMIPQIYSKARGEWRDVSGRTYRNRDEANACTNWYIRTMLLSPLPYLESIW